jgi:hypothetical protein
MTTTSTERPSASIEDDDTAALDATATADEQADSAIVDVPRRRRWMRRSILAVSVAAAVVAVVAALVVRSSGPELSTEEVAGAVPVRAEPLPPRPVLPDHCVLADNVLVVSLVETLDAPGGGGIDNPFVATLEHSDLDRVVAARILGPTAGGQIGLWGVIDDGGFVPLNDAASAVSGSANLDAGVLASAAASVEAELVTTCARLSSRS